MKDIQIAKDVTQQCSKRAGSKKKLEDVVNIMEIWNHTVFEVNLMLKQSYRRLPTVVNEHKV